ncbi:MAG: zinc ABC transporter substrate-binding protein [Candidatus Hydrogenedentota bacterium]
MSSRSTKYMRMGLAAMGVLLVLGAGMGCGGVAGERDNGVIQVVATTGMVADTARNVAGDRASVTGLMGPGVDPHMYRASQQDLRRLREADLLLYNGLYLEGRMAQVFDRMSQHRPTVAVAEAVPEEEHIEAGDYGGLYDPHIWFDVSLWKSAVEAVRDALIEVDPEGRETYEANAEAYLAELEALHEEVKEKIASIPEEKRVLVTAHDAFGYFGKAYDIEVMALQGISTAAEFGLRDITDLARTIAEREIPAVFIETTINPQGVNALIEGIRERGHAIQDGGELYSDALGADGTPEGTYVGMVRYNVDTIVEAWK